MTSNPEPIVPQMHHDFQNLLAYVKGPQARSQTAYTVEKPRQMAAKHQDEGGRRDGPRRTLRIHAHSMRRESLPN
jgi:hypothetical protein